MKKLLTAILLFIGLWITSQVKGDTMFVNGANWIPVFSKSSFYVDKTNSKSVFEIAGMKHAFHKCPNHQNLILKRQPNSVWIHSIIKNTGKAEEYWLGVYSLLDTLSVYRKTSKGFVLLNKSVMSDLKKIENPEIRFHHTAIFLERNETAELYMKICHSRHFLDAYADFTTVTDNLVWETGFYWEIGFLLGAASIIAFLSLLCGIILRKRYFYFYTVYLIFLITIILREELFINIITVPFLHDTLYRSNSLFILMIVMGLGLRLIIFLSEIRDNSETIFKMLNFIGNILIVFGIFNSFWFYVNYENVSFDSRFYNFIWNTTIVLCFFSVLVEVSILFWCFIWKRRSLTGILFSFSYLIVNPVTFYFNFSKDFGGLRDINHPNYFYYIFFLESFALGIVVAYNYRKIKSQYISTLEDKLKLEEENSKIKQMEEEKIKQSILESHEHLLKNLSKDLHDDIGQKLSIINFSVENLRFAVSSKESINEIRSSILEISDSVRDLSHWLNDFSIGKNTIDEIILNEVERIKKTNIIKINFEKINNSSENYETSTEENIILYRCFQESINNILKHSDASQINILIDYTNLISISIEDNGNGFDVNNQFGNGLKNIKERASLIGFSCTIQSSQEKGTKILIYKNDKSSNY